MATGFMAMRFGWVAYVVPFLFVYEPEILLQGDWTAIAWSGARAAICTVLVSVALVGYLRTSLSILGRGAAFLAGLFLFASFIVHDHVMIYSAIGLALAAIMVATQYLMPRVAVMSK